MTTIYGIKNCETMKKACVWLDQNGVRYIFCDYKTMGISAALLKTWLKQVGWEVLMNTRGTTWRKLSPLQQANLDDAKATALMIEYPSLIKGPVIEHNDRVLVGFAPDGYAKFFKQ